MAQRRHHDSERHLYIVDLFLTNMLFCFDVDGTLDCKENDNEEYLKGIIPEKVLDDLYDDGHDIAIVSPSPYFPQKWKHSWFCRNSSNDYRWENIKNAMNYYKVKENKVIYVDDLEGNFNMFPDCFKDITCYTPDKFMAIHDNLGWFK